jgi:hypothetical protein
VEKSRLPLRQLTGVVGDAVRGDLALVLLHCGEQQQAPLPLRRGGVGVGAQKRIAADGVDELKAASCASTAAKLPPREPDVSSDKENGGRQP